MFSASFFLQTRSANVVWVPNLFLSSFIQFPLFLCLFFFINPMTTFLQLGVNGRCQNQVCFFFLSTNFLCPFLYPFSLEPNSIVGEKDVQSELSGSLGRERVADRALILQPGHPPFQSSLGSFCSLINICFLLFTKFFFAFFTHCDPGPSLGTCIFS